MRTTRLLLLGSAFAPFAGLLAASCGSSSSGGNQPDASADAQVAPDTGAADTTLATDGNGADTGNSDAEGSDAGNADTGTTDAMITSDGSPSCTGFAYCDDFESYAVGTVTNGEALGPWAASVTGVTMTVDSVRPYQSTKSLHIQVPMGASTHGTLTQKKATGLIPGNNMFGRTMVYYADATGNGLPLGVHSWLFNSDGNSTVDDGGPVTMNMGGGGDKLQLNYHPPPDAGEQSIQGGTITAGAWHCIQWQYDGSGSPPANVANVWIDGTLAVNAPVTKGWQFATPWTSFDFGFTHYQSLDANAVDVFLDDFALGNAKIACP